jgi:hypothetical protein
MGASCRSDSAQPARFWGSGSFLGLSLQFDARPLRLLAMSDAASSRGSLRLGGDGARGPPRRCSTASADLPPRKALRPAVRTHLAGGYQFARKLDKVGVDWLSRFDRLNGFIAPRLFKQRRLPPMVFGRRAKASAGLGAEAGVETGFRGRKRGSGSQRTWEHSLSQSSSEAGAASRTGAAVGRKSRAMAGAAHCGGRSLKLPLLCDGRCSLQTGKSSLSGDIRLQGRVSGNLGGAQGGVSFSGLHLAEAGNLGIARGYAGGHHGGAGAGRSPDMGRLGRLRYGQASMALMGGKAAAHFLLPGECGIGLAQ